ELFAVFGHFENLNLLALIEDLRAGRTARSAWLSGSLLCPVAHGLPRGQHVRDLLALGQTDELGAGCDFAARQLRADPDDVLRFVRAWDEDALDTRSLLRQLVELWDERRADADAVQCVLDGIGDGPEQEPSGVAGYVVDLG